MCCAEAGFGSSLNYLEAVRVSVDVEVLDGDLGIIAHRLSTVGAGWWTWAAGEKQQS